MFMIVPKDHKYYKACMRVYLNEDFDSNQMNQNFDVNCAMIHNPCFPMLNSVVEKLKKQGLEIRIILTPDDYECIHDLGKIDFDVIELNPYTGDIKAKNKALHLKKKVEAVIHEKNEKEVNKLLWNLQNVYKVYVKRGLMGKIKEYDNVVFV